MKSRRAALAALVVGVLLANGDLLQVPGDHGIESLMIFLFPDSSLFEETVSFTQHGVFALQSYHLVQRGPAFADDLDASLSADARYLVKAKSHRDGKEKQYDGRLDLPPDVSNGLVVTLLKNLARQDTQTVHLVAFTPAPRLIRLELAPAGEEQVLNGLVGFFARLLGKMPPDSHAWIVVHDVPAFVRVVGPLYTGPVLRVDLSSPHWPR